MVEEVNLTRMIAQAALAMDTMEVFLGALQGLHFCLVNEFTVIQFTAWKVYCFIWIFVDVLMCYCNPILFQAAKCLMLHFQQCTHIACLLQEEKWQSMNTN